MHMGPDGMAGKKVMQEFTSVLTSLFTSVGNAVGTFPKSRSFDGVLMLVFLYDIFIIIEIVIPATVS